MANRHGLIAGAIATGKAVTIQALAESFNRRAIPVFMPDVKGDLADVSQTGGNNPKIVERAKASGLRWMAPALPAEMLPYISRFITGRR